MLKLPSLPHVKNYSEVIHLEYQGGERPFLTKNSKNKDQWSASQNIYRSIKKIRNNDCYVETKQRARLVSPNEQEICKMKSCTDNKRQKEIDARKYNTMLASKTRKAGVAIHFQVESSSRVDKERYKKIPLKIILIAANVNIKNA